LCPSFVARGGPRARPAGITASTKLNQDQVHERAKDIDTIARARHFKLIVRGERTGHALATIQRRPRQPVSGLRGRALRRMVKRLVGGDPSQWRWAVTLVAVAAYLIA
jgi:hypothetical protein